MRNGLFAPWEAWRKGAAVAMALFVALLVIKFAVPLGIAMVGVLFLAAFIWKSPQGTPDYDRMQYTMYTRAFRVATFFHTVSMYKRDLFSPVVMFGAGPPREDPDHVTPGEFGEAVPLQPGFWPPFRLSAWWALLGALVLAPIDIAINAVRAPVWGFDIPWFIIALVTIPGWFAFFQVIADERRIAPDKDRGGLAEPAPATMLNMINDHIELRPSVVHSAAYATIPVTVIFLLWIVVKWPWWVTLIAAGASFVVMAGALWSRNLMTEYRAKWAAREALAEQWQGVWVSLLPSNAGIPIFANEWELPTPEDHQQALRKWEAEVDNEDDLDREPPEYEVLVKCANFHYAPGMTLEKVAQHVAGVRGALSAGLVAIVPIGEMNALQQEIHGTVGSTGFRVYYSEEATQLPKLLDPNANEWATILNIQARIVEPLSQVKGIGRVVLVQHYMVTRPDSPQQIICVKLRPRDPSVSIDMFLERLDDIHRAAGVRWVRVGQGNDEGEITMYLGEEPVMDHTLYIRPASREHETIDRMNWLYYFHANKLRGASGTPRLIRREPTTPVVDKLTFSLPPGLAIKAVKAAQESIATTSGNEFIEIALTPPKDPAPARLGRPAERPQMGGTQFSIIAARENPLRRVFNFTDYADKVMTGREPGVAKINWAAGVLSDDTLAYDDWDNADNPHLLFAGASGSGKSVSMSSFLCQLITNNAPTEAQVWAIEPKNELQAFSTTDTFTRFVDSWNPNREFVKNAADLVEDAVREMDRRNEAFVTHPKQPKKLAKAREIAIRESEQQGTPLERHPLYMPYLFIIIEECASLFAGVRPDEREDQGRLMGAVTEIARKARSAGIHLVLATQYPTKESLPVTVRNQCRSVGFKCQNEVASRVVIGETGLEDINIKGAGKLRIGDQYRLFRGFWVADGDPDHGEVNDIFSTLDKVPSNNGQASALRRAGEIPRVSLPELPESVFALWDRASSGGRAQQELVSTGRGMYTANELESAPGQVDLD